MTRPNRTSPALPIRSPEVERAMDVNVQPKWKDSEPTQKPAERSLTGVIDAVRTKRSLQRMANIYAGATRERFTPQLTLGRNWYQTVRIIQNARKSQNPGHYALGLLGDSTLFTPAQIKEAGARVPTSKRRNQALAAGMMVLTLAPSQLAHASGNESAQASPVATSSSEASTTTTVTIEQTTTTMAPIVIETTTMPVESTTTAAPATTTSAVPSPTTVATMPSTTAAPLAAVNQRAFGLRRPFVVDAPLSVMAEEISAAIAGPDVYDARTLALYNGITDINSVQAGDTIFAKDCNFNQDGSPLAGAHLVHAGETIEMFASNHQTTTDNLRSINGGWNDLSGGCGLAV